MKTNLGEALWERNQLVAVLTKLAPPGKAWLSQHPEEDKEWDDEWRTIVFIDFPTGQTSWHIHDSEVSWFSHLPERPNTWDGHTIKEKYRRLQELKVKSYGGIRNHGRKGESP